MSRARPYAALAAALAIGVGAWLAVSGPHRPEPAPAVAYTLLDGTPGATDQWRGKVVLVNFWATSCTICVAEMPQLAATHEKFRGRGFETLAVAMQHDPPAYVKRYAEARRLPFGVAIDHTGEIARRFGGVEATPTTLIINKRGEIVKRYVGAPDFARLQALLEKLLAEA